MIFDWFAPAAPLEPREKAWVEVRMQWLADQFGIDRLVRAEVVQPTTTYFPDAYDGTPEAAQRYLDRLCGYMGVLPPFQLIVHDNQEMGGLSAQYELGTIHVARSLLGDAVALIATMAHALAHHLLFSQKRLSGDEPDRQWVSDLLPVFLGLGIFLGNATLREKCHHAARHSGHSYGKFVYLTAPMLGYALAMFAWLRGEEEPAWESHLQRDVAATLRGSLRYLTATEDCLLRPDNMHRPPSLSLSALLDRLENGSPSERVAALWAMAADTRAATAETVAIVSQVLSDRRAEMRAEAARTLGALAPAAAAALPDLVAALDDGDDEVRTAAAYAIGKLGAQPEMVVPALVDRLEDANDLTAAAAALAIAQFGHAAVSALPDVLSALKGSLMVNRYPTMDYLVHAVRAISPEPEADLAGLVESCDPELRQQAPGMLAECGPVAAPNEGPGAWFAQFSH
jgi:hypothetical protein